MKTRVLLAVAVALVVASCSAGEDAEVEPLPGGRGDDAVTSGLGDPGAPNPAADDGDSLDGNDGVPAAVQYATDDLARYLGVSVDVVDWVSYESVTWSNGSLGCPQEGVAYTEALVPGELIVFEVEGVTHEYHSAVGSDPFLCLTPEAPLPREASHDR